MIWLRKSSPGPNADDSLLCHQFVPVWDAQLEPGMPVAGGLPTHITARLSMNAELTIAVAN